MRTKCFVAMVAYACTLYVKIKTFAYLVDKIEEIGHSDANRNTEWSSDDDSD